MACFPEASPYLAFKAEPLITDISPLYRIYPIIHEPPFLLNPTFSGSSTKSTLFMKTTILGTPT